MKLTKAIAVSKKNGLHQEDAKPPPLLLTTLFLKKELWQVEVTLSNENGVKWNIPIYSLILPFYGQIYSPRVKVQNLEQNALKIEFSDIVKILAATCDWKWVSWIVRVLFLWINLSKVMDPKSERQKVGLQFCCITLVTNGLMSST